MATLSELLVERTRLTGDQVEHLKRLVAEWQLISDLAFADFLLWVRQDAPSAFEGEDPDRQEYLGGLGKRVVCVAQCRPTTSTTLLPGDMVGTEVGEPLASQLHRGFEEGRIIEPEDPMWLEYVPTRREVVPVHKDGEVIAVATRYVNLLQPRSAGNLETAYTSAADALCQMVCDGSFPDPVDKGPGPRAGDGFMRLAETGAITYASPNASSALRRLGWEGTFMGSDLVEILRATAPDSLAAEDSATALAGVLRGEAADARIEAEANGAVTQWRVVGLRQLVEMAGAVVLLRDVTELRHRDRALISKDATIREIHHRVKNNLQSVSALLRMQARRTANAEARQALEDSVRRIGSIALVHDALSISADEHVSVDDIVDKLIVMLSELCAPGTSISVRRQGRFGFLEAERAMSLTTILTELAQNALEHAFQPGDKGEVVIWAERKGKWLSVEVADSGVGFPEGFDPKETKRLGLRIAATLAESELQASLELGRSKLGGSSAKFHVPVNPVAGRRWSAER
ncbi:MAG: sensor histidine kinase [Segniliparus sp.]|uniref:sensor histidine kinase n=1 Tax=Segniliparus sp. TaxID=2804064 RepID=UPI003F39FF69